jgi:ADP-heptose:LPS heptosyltransferase
MKTPLKILYTPPRGIGDMIFSLPLLNSLKQAYPNAKILIPIPKDKQEILDLVGFAEKTLQYLPKPSEDPLAMQRWQASGSGNTTERYRLEKLIYEKYLKGEKFDLAIIPKNFTLENISCPLQISENDINKSGTDTKEIHMVDRFLSFADYLGIKRKMCFDLLIDKNKRATLNSGDEFLTKKPYIVFNLGASLNKKIWSEKGYIETASWCADNGFDAVLVGDKDCFEKSKIIQAKEKRIINTILKNGYSFNLKNLAILAHKANAVVGPDTGIVHLSDAIGAKTIGLYGPTSPLRYGPYNNQNNIISTYHSDRCMSSINSTQVIKKLEEILR